MAEQENPTKNERPSLKRSRRGAMALAALPVAALASACNQRDNLMDTSPAVRVPVVATSLGLVGGAVAYLHAELTTPVELSEVHMGSKNFLRGFVVGGGIAVTLSLEGEVLALIARRLIGAIPGITSNKLTPLH